MAVDKDIGRNDEDLSLENILQGDYESNEEFSLEAILAEYKGQAFIDGDKKTPSDILDKKTESIVKEVTGRLDAVDVSHAEEAAVSKPVIAVDKSPKASETENKAPYESKKEKAFRDNSAKNDRQAKRPVKSVDEDQRNEATSIHKASSQPVEPAAEPLERASMPARKKPVRSRHLFNELSGRENTLSEFSDTTYEGFSDNDARVADSLEYSNPDAGEKHAGEVEETLRKGERILEKESDIYEEGHAAFSFFKSRRKSRIRSEFSEDTEELEEAEDLLTDDEPEEEPNIEEEIKRFSVPIPSLRIRIAVSGVLCLFMLIITFMFQGGKSIPFGIGTNQLLVTGVLLIMQFTVMIFGIDILADGIKDLINIKPGAETLTVISCIITALDGIIMLVRQSFDSGLPFSLISACSVFFCMGGRKAYMTAMRDSLKMSAISSSPYGVVSESESLKERAVLKKVAGKTGGFYHKLTRADSCENAYVRAVPLLVLAALVFSVLASVGRGQSYNFAHCLAIMVSVTAAFPSASAFATPFLYAVTRAKRAGCAIAGWGGACDMSDADAALITDEDIFPVGTMSLSGIKLFEGTSQKKAVAYTASLIVASESGLSKIFSELLRSQGLAARRVEDFSCYEGGGLGALIDGERVLVGSGGFMNLMGIRVPESVNTKNTIFTAVNDELAAVFTINYIPANSVQSALVAILNTRINMLLAVRDFNVTPDMIQKKFRVSMEGVEYMPVELSYRVSDTSGTKELGASAILCREGLAPFAEVITRGRLLKLVTDINVAISVIGSAIGLLLMFFLCWTAAFTSASANNAFIFMMAVEACVLLMSQVVRRRL